MKRKCCSHFSGTSRRLPGVKRLFPVFAVGIMIASTPKHAMADEIWNFAGDGYWDVASNWSSLTVPTVADNVFNHSAFTITVSNDVTPNYQAFGAALTNDGGGTLQVNNGAQLNISGAVDNSNNSSIVSDGSGTAVNLGIGTASFTNDASNLSSSNSGKLTLKATDFYNQDGGSINTFTSGTVNINATNLTNTGTGSSIGAFGGGLVNIGAATLTTTDLGYLFVGSASTMNVTGDKLNILAGGNIIATDSNTTFNIGKPDGPMSSVVFNGTYTQGGNTYYSLMSTQNGANSNIYTANLNIENGAFVNTIDSSTPTTPTVLNIGDASHAVSSIDLTNGQNQGISDLGANSGTVNAWATKITVDGASQIYSYSALNLGSRAQMVNQLTINGDGSAAYVDASSGGAMTIYANNVNLTDGGNLNSYGIGSNLAINAQNLTNDGTDMVSFITANGGGALTMLANTLTNENGGQIYVTDAHSSLTLGTQATPISTLNNLGESGGNYTQIGSRSGDTLQLYATTISNTNGGVFYAGQFSIASDAGSVTNLGDSSHWVTTLTNSGLAATGASAIRAHFGSTVNVYASTVNNQNGALIYSLQDNTTAGLSGGTLNLTASTINNTSHAALFSTGTGSQTLVTATSFNNDSTVEAVFGGYTKIGAANFNNTSNGFIYADGKSSVDIAATNTISSSGTILVDPGGSITSTGSINQTGGSTTVDGTLNAAALNLSGGTLQGTGTILSNVNQTGGTFNPGQDPGNMNITGNYSLSNGTYVEQIASLTNFDTLSITGSSNITGGVLSLDFLSGYHPLLNNSWKFLLAAGGFGTTDQFNSISSNLGSNYGFRYNSGVITITQAPPPVPEASTVLAMLGLFGTTGGLSILRRARKV